MSSVDFEDSIENIPNPYSITTYSSLFYFLEKYSDKTCVIIDHIVWKTHLLTVDNSELVVPSDLFDRIDQCDKRFIFGFIELIDEMNFHQNVFIIDKLENSVEIFEPNGYVSPKYFHNKEYLKQLKNLFSSYTFYKATDFCPKNSFQAIEGQGYCQAWSIWWVDYRLKYSTKTRKQLVDEALKKYRKNITNFIETYARHMRKIRNDFVKKYSDYDVGRFEISINSDNPDPLGKEYDILEQVFKDKLEELSPVIYNLGNCEDKKCKKYCRVETGNCVTKALSNEKIIQNKYLVTSKNVKLVPTIYNFKQVAIREFIYENCRDKLTKDELYLVLFYDTPIKNANNTWKKLKN